MADSDVVIPQGITGDFFDRILTKNVFMEEVHSDFYKRSEELGVHPHWNRRNIQDAYQTGGYLEGHESCRDSGQRKPNPK